jgi:uncharacterized protein (TIGR03437 family)
MSCARHVCACLVIASAACLAGGDDFPPPRLSTVVPASGSPGQPVMLLGDHLCGTPDDDSDETEPVACDQATGSVQFGGEPAESYGWMMTSVGVTVPLEARPGPTSVRVTVAGRTSNSVRFVVEMTGP